MKQTLNNKALREDSGIAIMFTLIMLSVFFLIAFGFVSMSTSLKAASTARQPSQDGSLSAEATVLNEALFAINEGLMKDGSNDPTEIPNYAKMNDFIFINTGLQEVTFKTYSTRSTDRTNLDTSIPLDVYTTDDFFPDTNTGTNPQWNSTGWITKDLNSDTVDDKYFWMIIESSGIDPNYVGGDPGNATGNRNGDYIRELDINTVDSNFSTVYVDWTVGTPTPWSDKKTLVNTLGSALETAVQLFEPGTSPITITERNFADGLFDLSVESPTLAQVQAIPWFANSSDTADATKLAYNFKDFVDVDNKLTVDNTTAPNVIGVERVPMVSEIAFTITNATADPSSSDQPTVIEITASPEFINPWIDPTLLPSSNPPFNVLDTSNSPNGVNARVVITGTVTANRTGANITNANFSIDINFPLHAQTNVEHIHNSSTTGSSGSISSGSISSAGEAVSDVSITVNSIMLYGDPDSASSSFAIWDYQASGTGLGSTSPTPIGVGGTKYVDLIRSGDPRDNQNPVWASGTASITQATAQANLGSYTYGGCDGDTVISNMYMPPGGAIENLTEIGYIHRGTTGETINLTDYNIKNSDRFVSARYLPSGTLDLGDVDNPSTSSFDGGDRSLLDYVYISNPGIKVTTAANLSNYKQFGAINPNTSQRKVVELLLNGVNPGPVPDVTGTLNATELAEIVNAFPGINPNSNQDEFFLVSDFHDVNGNTYHNRNPKTFGFPFSRMTPALTTPLATNVSPSATFSDADREALVIKSMNLVSPKYSYFTILGAVEISAAITKIKAFVRRDADSGSFKIIRFNIN